MKAKISILFLLLAVSASAATIYPVQEGLFFKIMRCGWHISCYRSLGSAVTEISGSTLFKNFPASYNATINSLNNTKIENASSSIAAITTLSNLVTVGTLTSGSLGSGFTTVAIARGGTGSTSPSGILWGDGAGAYTSIGQGTAGQLLTSNGDTIPTFGNGAVNLNLNYVWGGQHTFGTTTPPTSFQNTQIRMTNDNARLGIGTSSPFMALSVATNTYIGGGLAVGADISTSTVGNVQIAGFVGIGGTTTTNGLAILGGNVCNGCTLGTTTQAKLALTTTADAINQVTVTCPGQQIVIGGGYKMITANQDELQSNKYIVYSNSPGSAGDTNYAKPEQSWTVGAKTVSGGGGEAGFLYAIAICANP